MNFYSALAAGAALLIATGAQADGHEEAAAPSGPTTYTMTGSVAGITLVGGTGRGDDLSYGASWTEAVTVTSSTGTVTDITANCIGMDQPSNSLFDRHFTCTVSDGESQEGALIFGCNKENEAGNEMSCVGYLQGKEGEIAEHVALVTSYYRFMSDGTGTVQGTGHWIR